MRARRFTSALVAALWCAGLAGCAVLEGDSEPRRETVSDLEVAREEDGTFDPSAAVTDAEDLGEELAQLSTPAPAAEPTPEDARTDTERRDDDAATATAAGEAPADPAAGNPPVPDRGAPEPASSAALDWALEGVWILVAALGLTAVIEAFRRFPRSAVAVAAGVTGACLLVL